VTAPLESVPGVEGLVVGDLIMAAVLRGFRDAQGFNEALRMLDRLEQAALCCQALAVESTLNFRKLRAKG